MDHCPQPLPSAISHQPLTLINHQPSVITMTAMQVVILSKPGWHADQLCRALDERGHCGRVLPYESLVARFTGNALSTLTGDRTSILAAAVYRF